MIHSDIKVLTFKTLGEYQLYWIKRISLFEPLTQPWRGSGVCDLSGCLANWRTAIVEPVIIKTTNGVHVMSLTTMPAEFAKNQIKTLENYGAKIDSLIAIESTITQSLIKENPAFFQQSYPKYKLPSDCYPFKNQKMKRTYFGILLLDSGLLLSTKGFTKSQNLDKLMKRYPNQIVNRL